MSHIDLSDDEMPVVGQEFDLSVVPSPTRTTLFPESFVLLSPSTEVMEIAFLRQELAVLSQRGVVSRASDASVDLQVRQTSVVGQIQDLGHIRMPPDKMVELAKSLILHAKAHHQLDFSRLMDDLGAHNAVASTESGAT